MAYYNSHCSQCSKEVEVYFGDRTMGKELIHSFSMYCENCGAGWEADGHGKLEPKYRAIVFKQEGVWELKLKVKEELGKALLVLKNIENLAIQDLTSIKTFFPFLYEGTKAEMEFISYWLTEKDIKHELIEKA